MFGAIIVISDHKIGTATWWRLTSEKSKSVATAHLLQCIRFVTAAGGSSTTTATGCLHQTQFYPQKAFLLLSHATNFHPGPVTTKLDRWFRPQHK